MVVSPLIMALPRPISLSLNSDGGLDTSFQQTIARLTADGALDINFLQSAAGFNGSVRAITILSNGKIVVGGQFTSFNSSTANYLARLTYIGTLD